MSNAATPAQAPRVLVTGAAGFVTVNVVRALAARGLEMAAEVSLGRARLDEVTRAPVRRARG